MVERRGKKKKKYKEEGWINGGRVGGGCRRAVENLSSEKTRKY